MTHSPLRRSVCAICYSKCIRSRPTIISPERNLAESFTIDRSKSSGFSRIWVRTKRAAPALAAILPAADGDARIWRAINWVSRLLISGSARLLLMISRSTFRAKFLIPGQSCGCLLGHKSAKVLCDPYSRSLAAALPDCRYGQNEGG